MKPFFPPHAGTLPPGRRLIIVSHHFPPSPAAGALRWQKLAGFAAERGWGLDVVMQDPAELSRADWSRVEGLPAGTRIYGVRRPMLAMERVERLAVRIRRALRPTRRPGGGTTPATGSSGDENVGEVIVPRERISWRLTAPTDYLRAFEAWMYFARDAAWNRPAVAVARALLQPGVHAAVITSGPPHMTHRAGAEVARAAGLPFVMDMRDPWSLARAVARHMASPLWLRLAARHERHALATAALVVTNTELMSRAMREAYPAARDRIVTVMNGYDEEVVPRVARGTRFTIAYAGTIYLDRDPRPLFRAASRLVREARLTPAQFGIEFIGHVERFGAVSVAALAREAGLGEYVHLGPPRPRQEMMEFLAGATMLCSLPQDLPLAIPSKIFEYMQFDAWLLVLAKTNSATELLLRGSGADVVDPQNEDQMVAVVRDRYAQFSQGIRPTALAADGRFSRRRQAQILFDALERCVANGRSW